MTFLGRCVTCLATSTSSASSALLPQLCTLASEGLPAVSLTLLRYDCLVASKTANPFCGSLSSEIGIEDFMTPQLLLFAYSQNYYHENDVKIFYPLEQKQKPLYAWVAEFWETLS